MTIEHLLGAHVLRDHHRRTQATPRPGPVASPVSPPRAGQSRRGGLTLVALVTALLAACTTGDIDDDLDDESLASAHEATAAEIVEQVAELRGSRSASEVPTEVVTSQATQEIAMTAGQDERSQVERSTAILRALHQIPADLDLIEVAERLAEDAFAGIYVPDADIAFVVAEDEDDLSPAERAVLAHEIVHALQDQQVDLSILADFEDDPDASLAFRSVIEGEAVIIEEQWAEEHLSDEEQHDRRLSQVQAQQDQEELMGSLPPAVVWSFITPYVDGPEFVGHLLEVDGRAAMDAALEDPPTTMVEIIDPSLYLDGFEPEMVALGDAPEGYAPFADMTWGAFEVEVLLGLADGFTPTSPSPAAWRGGRLQAWSSDVGLVVAVGWTFATVNAAAEVCDAVPAWHTTTADSRPTDDPGVYEGPEDVLVVDCDGQTIRYAVGPDAAAARTAIDMDR